MQWTLTIAGSLWTIAPLKPKLILPIVKEFGEENNISISESFEETIKRREPSGSSADFNLFEKLKVAEV